MSKFENPKGEYFMSRNEVVEQVTLMSVSNLGRGNLGTFGPSSAKEAQAAHDVAMEKYSTVATSESHCMDDRFEGHGVQLPGNRAITEIAGYYMDAESNEIPLSQAVEQTVQKLIELDRVPFFHGDEATGKAGCAANVNLRMVLSYNSDHRDQVVEMVYDRLRILGRDSVSKEEIAEAVDIGGERASKDSLWDVDAKQVVETAEANGANYEVFKGAHHTFGAREDFSVNVFDNGSFRNEHQTDDEHPFGALSITYGAYAEQLVQDGFSEPEIDKKLTHATLFSVGILKIACKEEAIDALVG